MPRLIFFCGHAGTGKTTLARRTIAALMAEAHVQCTGESFCLLDKDTLYGDYSSAVMGVLTGDPNDRDSPPYLQHLRNPEYHGLMKTARENLGLGVSTIVVGPLSREVKAHQLADRAWLGVADDVQVRIVWVTLQEAEARRHRGQGRSHIGMGCILPCMLDASARPVSAGGGYSPLFLRGG